MLMLLILPAGLLSGADSSSRWLDPQQELLLPLEMGQLIARFQEYIQHQLMQNAWVKMEQVIRVTGIGSG